MDPGFVPATLWNRRYRSLLRKTSRSEPLSFALEQSDGAVSIFETEILPHSAPFQALNLRYVERLLKFLLWQRGGSCVTIGGNPTVAAAMARVYSPNGERAFDHDFIGRKVYGHPLEIRSSTFAATPRAYQPSIRLGRHFDGCRIGFDLGGTGRKCAALIDGQVVFSEWVAWNPCFESDPAYHYAAINDTLRRAAARLPRVDAIGGSAAGIYVNNEVRAASLFRSVGAADFQASICPMFLRLAREWGGVPFEVANDGEVSALAGSMALNENSVLGISLGTSQAGGYVDAAGGILPWLNELAFTPVDFRQDAPLDPWSGDAGCGVQYFSQQGVSRLLAAAGIPATSDATDAERLSQVQELMAGGDPRSRAIYETLGIYLGYSVAHYADFYSLRHLLLTGGVTSGPGGQVMAAAAQRVLSDEFPGLSESVCLHLPDEKEKSCGQAAAAATLPKLGGRKPLLASC